ncbi:MAG: ATP-binding protein [Candidatus Contendobacter sp.]|nr:ATP-binding protein [Candidatus Contendobacter sp.]
MVLDLKKIKPIGKRYYFLSCPRRFGKSLFLDTLAELFAGNEPLFRDLFVHDRWDWAKRYPIIRFSFGGGVVQSPEDLERKIREQLRINQATLGLSCTETGIDGCFAELIRQAHAASGQRLVVLVDEYDKPILDNLTRPDTARIVRDGLRNLYSVIKDSDAHIRFAFLTGVSKFSKVNLFSGLNNLRDITLSRDYSALCGYTDADVDTVFAPELAGLDREQIRHWYNGYNWTGTAVYNPFDLLLLFQERQFRPWWFETGSPTFLIDLLTDRQTWLPNLGRLETDAALLSAFDVGHIATEALMFQTGYLTIAREEDRFGEYWYRLRYPNQEVYQSLINGLLKVWTPNGQAMLGNKRRLGDLLLANDFAGMERLFAAFFASIPADWYRNNPIARYEGYYASVFYAYFASLGLDITPEDASSHGRLDLTVKFNGQIYLFEFKVVELEPEGRALRQIKNRGYADKYRADGQPIHLIGVEFSRDQRAVVGFEVEMG